MKTKEITHRFPVVRGTHLYLFSCVAAVLILFGHASKNSPLSFLASVFYVFAALLLPIRYSFYLLLMLLPFSQIALVGGTEVTTIILGIYVIKLIIDKEEINARALVSCCLLSAYELGHVFISGAGLDLSTIKWILAIFTFFQLLSTSPYEYSQDDAVKYLATGTCIFSLGVLLGNAGVILDSVSRNSLLFIDSLDANTFSLYCLVTVCLLLGRVLDASKPWKTKALSIVAMLVIFFGGAYALSKTYVILAAVAVLAYLLVALRRPIAAILVIVSALILIYFISFSVGAESIIDSYIARFSESTGLGLSGLTTGRSDIFLEYINYLIKPENTLTFIFGAGLFGYFDLFGIGMRPHNCILEGVSAWGIAGLLLFIVSIFWCSGGQNSKKMHVSQINLQQFSKYCIAQRSGDSEYVNRPTKWIPLAIMIGFMQALTLLYQYYTFFYLLICIYEIKKNSDVRKNED